MDFNEADNIHVLPHLYKPQFTFKFS